MAKNSFEQRRSRREQLLGLLRSSDYWTTSELSVQLGISHRTLMRDLSELRSAGYPIESERGRGGGVRLNGRWGIERLQLNHHEVIEMILAVSVVEGLKSPLFGRHLKSIRQKIASIFPEPQRKVIASIRRRILLGDSASNRLLECYSRPATTIAELVAEAFIECKSMTIRYQTEQGVITDRIIEPHYVLVNWPVWYVLAWDHLRNDIRLFRLDRIVKCNQNKAVFRLHHTKEFIAFYQPFFTAL